MTYTGATEVAGPGSVGKDGKGVSAHYIDKPSQLNVPTKRKQGTYSLLDISSSLASGEVGAGAGGEGRRDGDDFRAVDELALVHAEERKAAHDVRERLGELLLVVGERLPLA